MAVKVRDVFATFVLAVVLFGQPRGDLLAQVTGSIRGRVIDGGTQRPISEATVKIAGTRLGAVTGANGDFLMTGVSPGANDVTVRRIGYARVVQTVAVTAGAETRLDVALRVNPAPLDAVVVTGTAGAAERRSIGNAITQLDVGEITDKSAVFNVTEVLQSKTPGLTLLPGSGTPGAASEFRIRGATSLSGYKPVVYIDGVRYNIESLGNFNPTGAGVSGQSTQVTSALDLISPNDIESIEVIKGPAAATLYGADAAAGVIQIITKKGSRGEQPTRWTAKAEAGARTWALPVEPNFTTCDAAKIASPTVWPGCAAPGVTRGQVFIQNPLKDDPRVLRSGALLRTSLSMRGGGDRYSFYIAGDRDRDEGVFRNSYNNRSGGRANFTFAPVPNGDLALSVGYVTTQLRLPVSDESGQAITLSAARGRPLSCATTADVLCFRTILPEPFNAYNNRTSTERLTLGATLNYQPREWFRNKLTLGLDNTQALAEILSAPGSEDTPEGLSALRIPRTHLYTIDYAGNVERALSTSFVSTTSVGAQVVASRGETLFGAGTGLGAPDITLIQTAANVSATNNFTENNSVGYYGQEQVAWHNRLFLTGAVRVDNNSSFGSNFKVIAYPKLSLSWVLSEEPGLRDVISRLGASSLRLRSAWGQAGRAPAPYSSVQTYTIDKVTVGGGTVTQNALRTAAYGNPDLRPERATEIETGIDASFGDRFGVEATFYDKSTRDMLVFTPTAPSSGFTSGRLTNLGKVTNRGVELSVFGTPVSRPRFAWDFRLNVSTNQNRLESFGDTTTRRAIPGQVYGTVQENRVGYPLGAHFVQFPLRDAAGRARLSSAGTVLLAEATYLGPSTPTREAGLSNTFTLGKRWRVYALLDYKGGDYLFNLRERNRCSGPNSNCRAVNDPALLARVAAGDSGAISRLKELQQVPALFVDRADFLKLRDLSLSYTLPVQINALLRADNATVTLAGHDLAVWSPYSGADPEVNSYGGRLFARADTYTVPMLRRITLALNLSF